MGVETRRVLAEGVWQVVFVVFLAYAMMPLKTWVAAVFGVFLPVVHVIVAAIFAKEFPSLTWQQVCVLRHKCHLIPGVCISFELFYFICAVGRGSAVGTPATI
jgi:type IV secretory pathway TrbD component